MNLSYVLGVCFLGKDAEKLIFFSLFFFCMCVLKDLIVEGEELSFRLKFFVRNLHLAIDVYDLITELRIGIHQRGEILIFASYTPPFDPSFSSFDLSAFPNGMNWNVNDIYKIKCVAACGIILIIVVLTRKW